MIREKAFLEKSSFSLWKKVRMRARYALTPSP